MIMSARDRGSILIMSLWSASILSILLASLVFQAGIQKQLIKAEMNQFEGHWALISGFNLATKAIAEDPEPYKDSPLDAWYGDLVLDTPWKGKVVVHIEDEESKLNLNLANEKLLREFFERLKREEGSDFEKDAKEIVKGIMTWRNQKKNRRFDFLEELLLIEEIAKKDFVVFKSYVTVEADVNTFPSVNINTVSSVVLEALIHSLAGDEFAKRELAGKILEYRDAERGKKEFSYYVREELEPRIFMEKLKLTPSLQIVSLVNQLMPYLTTDSSTFQALIEAPEQGKRAGVIFRYGEAQAQPEILEWRED